MAVLPIYIYGQPVLRKKAKHVRHADEAIAKFVEDMFETMHKGNGIGLAANQVGSLHRIIVVDLSTMDEERHQDVSAPKSRPLAMINPEVVYESGKFVMEEGCLSIPGIREEVERVETIRVRYKDVQFRDQEVEATGLLARVILHEIDHLNGVLFVDRVGIVKRKLLRGRLNKIAKGEVEVSYPVVAAANVGAEAA